MLNTLWNKVRVEVKESLFRLDPSLRSALWRGLFVRNPAVIAFFTLLFSSPGHYLEYASVGLFIATLVNLFCILTVHLVASSLAAWQAWRSRRVPPRLPSWYWMISALAMPPSVWAAFEITGRLCHWLHVPWEEPDGAAYRVSILLGSFILLLFYLSKTRGEAREKLRELETENLRAKLAALTAQMNPHLLFNSLNTVASLIPTEPAQAEATIVTLSDLYRGVLRAAAQSEHSLADELALCRSYLDLERARFGDRLRVSFAIDDAIPLEKCRVPVLTLQPLVENAVKHGIAPRAQGGEVILSVRRDGASLLLQVADDGAGFGRSPHHGNGAALENCRTRLRLSYGEAASLNIDDKMPGAAVTLRLPWEASCAP